MVCRSFSVWFPPVGPVFLLAGLLLTGCASSRSPSSASSSTASVQSAEAVETQLRTAAADWQHVPHEWGGTSRQGVDCSGLVQSVYASKFRLTLPRTTEEQVDAGRRVRRSSLKPGDLVFFRHKRKKYHVGIYVADGEFLHASSSEGVTVSPLDRSYWNDRWWQARRILSVAADSSRGSSSPARQPSAEKVGW